MLKHKTSVLFVDNTGSEKKTILIPTLILLKWKRYLLMIVAIFSLLIGLLGFSIYSQTRNYYHSAYNEKLLHSKQIIRAIDLDKAKKSFQSINQSMKRINTFMEKRGLSDFKLKNAGGPEEFEMMQVNEMYEFYAEHILEMENFIENIPLGVPHDGEKTSGFGYRYNPFGGMNVESHAGIDFRGNVGEPVKSTARGKVIFAGEKGGYGNCVIIKHANNFETLYGHLSEISVKENQSVEVGEAIGKLGNTGRSTGPHLHYEIIYNGDKVNPEDYLNL
ncbi:M23 family metallopeptidase [Moheibacter sediminis]|uniref:Peptidase family M23 n=1 Tax=Moheibacter sediminis TaxID=1434700 RepID=A0A1W1YP03_9FLAO|nr:M23 family metallopeptidase [Moheibacter sediminis]SMC37541.1 Peptidase family M23 [Moheibacter sediminis]